MQHLASPSVPEKCAMRETIELEVQRFLEQGGKITVLERPSSDERRSRGSLWQGNGDDFLDDSD